MCVRGDIATIESRRNKKRRLKPMKTSFKKDEIFAIMKKNLVILGIVLLVGILSIGNALTKEVLIRDDGKETYIKGIVFNVEDVLAKGNIELHENDRLSMKMDEKIEDGMKIVIERAFPITIQADGEKMEVMTAFSKVSEVLQEHEVTFDSDDVIEPAIDGKVGRNDTITIKRMKHELVTEETTIPFEKIIKYTAELDKGKLKVLQPGREGKKAVEYKIVFENGKEISREKVGEEILEQAQNEIVEQGTAQYLATSRGNLRVGKVIRMISTAYDATFASTGKNPGDKHYRITRSGTTVRPGVVAVDPRVIPLGTELYIKALDGSEDYGFAIAEDTGGAIKGNKIDLFMEDPKDVKRHGRRPVEVYILD